MSEILRDLRQGLRAIARRPGVAAVVVVTLAVGIGASAAIFTVVNAVLLRPLPYREADRLVAAFAHETRRGEARNPTSPADFLEWGRGSAALDRLTAAHPWSPVLTGRGRPEELPALKASPSLFGLLGVEPALGRVFHSPSEEPQVVLSYGLWQRRFGADRGLIGQALTLDGKSYVVAGVMPPASSSPRSGPPKRSCGRPSSSRRRRKRATAASCESSGACARGRPWSRRGRSWRWWPGASRRSGPRRTPASG